MYPTNNNIRNKKTFLKFDISVPNFRALGPIIFFLSKIDLVPFKQIWQDVYSVSVVLDNEFMVLLSRIITYVQERESISSVCL